MVTVFVYGRSCTPDQCIRHITPNETDNIESRSSIKLNMYEQALNNRHGKMLRNRSERLAFATLYWRGRQKVWSLGL